MTKKNVLPEILLLQKFAAAQWPRAGSRESAEAKVPLSKFLRNDPSSIQRWLVMSARPLGLQIIKLRVFLEAVGYTVPALKKMKHVKPAAYKLAELLAFDIISAEDARQMFGLNQANRVFAIAQSGQFLIEERVKQINALYEANREFVAEKRALLPVPSRTSSSQRIPSRTEADIAEMFDDTPSETSKVSAGVVLAGEVLLRTAAYQALTLIPFVELLASEACTAEDRKEFRLTVEGKNVIRLSEALNKLVSESARKEILAIQSGG